MKKIIRKEIKLNPEEWEEICKRAKFLHMRTGTYIRDIAVKKEMKKFDSQHFNRLLMSFHRIGNQIEQMLRVAQRTNSEHTERLEKILNRYEHFQQIFYKYISPLKK